MHAVRRATIVSLAVIGFSLTAVPTAGAYLDPGTGSMVIQAVIGGLAAVGIVFATFWRRIVGLFSRRSKSTEGTLQR